MSNTEPLREKGSRLIPIKRAPGMATINGIGLSLYGNRDYDPNSRTYVKTRCFCVVFVPVLAIDAFRVQDAGFRSWRFLGREPLSAFAKGWNLLLVAGLISTLAAVGVMSAWDSYSHSPAHVAAAALAQAQKMQADGKVSDAAKIYSEVARSGTPSAAPADTALAGIVKHDLNKLPGDQAVAVLDSVLLLDRALHRNGQAALEQSGLAYFNAHLAGQPKDAERMYDGLLLATKDHATLDPLRETLLQSLCKADPNDPKSLSELALIYESRKDEAGCEKLLAGHEKILGDTEGARILGQIYSHEGKTDAAYPLLSAYTIGRMTLLHKAELAEADAEQRASNEALHTLNYDTPPAWQKQYEALKDKAAKQKLVDDYLTAEVIKNPQVKQRIADLEKAEAIVPVALDLGITRMERAQKMTDPQQRKAELLEIQKLFLSLQSYAGGSPEYHMFFGQVLYWLGKPEEGRKQFDDLLKSTNRDPDVLYEVAQRIRDLGDADEGIKLAEEAYHVQKDIHKRYDIAAFIAIASEDTGDRLKWLKLANPADPVVAAELKAAEGLKAEQVGDTATAIACYKDAVAAYGKLNKSASQLNQSGLLNSQLFGLTFDPAYLQSSLDELKEAVALKPRDSIVTENYVGSLESMVTYKVFAKRLDCKALGSSPDLTDMGCVCHSEAEMQALREQIQAMPEYAEICASTLRMLTLAPEDQDLLFRASQFSSAMRDLPAMQLAVQRRQAYLAQTTADKPAADATAPGGPPAPPAAPAAPGPAGTAGKGAATPPPTEDPKVDAAKQAIEKAAGEGIKKYLAILENQIQAVNKEPASEAYVLSQWTVSATAGIRLHLPIDLNLLRQRSDQAVALDATGMTLYNAADTHFSLAEQALRSSDPAFKAFDDRYANDMTVMSLFAVALNGGLPDTAPILADPDFKRAVALLLKRRAAFDQYATPTEWAIVRSAAPDSAPALLKRFTTMQYVQLDLKIDSLWSPDSANTALLDYFAALGENHPEAARDGLKAAIAKGVTVPALP